MISYWAKSEGGGAVSATHLGRDMWAYCADPTDAELDALARDHGLERDLLADAVDPLEVPRVQREGDSWYFFLRAPSGEAEQTHTVPLLVVLAPQFLLTVSPRPLRWLERFRDGNHWRSDWRSQMVWRILLSLAARYQQAVNDIARRIRAAFGTAQQVSNEEVIRLVTYEGVLNDFLAALVPMEPVMENLSAGKHMKLYAEDHDLVEDARLALAQVVAATKGQLKTTTNLRDAYSVIATNNLNRIIKFLTLITVVLTVPMVISGLFGMNMVLPLASRAQAFWLIVGLTLIIVIALLRVLKHKRLL